MKNLFSFVFAFMMISGAAYAAGTATTSVTTASTTVLAANDVPGGRHYLLIQSLGSPVVNCTIGATAATTSTGISLSQYGSIFMQAVQGSSGVFVSVPNGEVDCIAASSTSNVTVISY